MNLFELAAKISLDSSDYEKGVKSSANSTKTLEERLKAASALSETMGNKINVLSSQYESSKAKVDQLTKAFNESVKNTGAASEESQRLAKELSNAENSTEKLSKELEKYAKSADDAEKNSEELGEEVEDAGKKAEKSSGKFSKLAEKIGLGLKTAAKIGTAAVTAAGTAIVALTKASVDSYAEYEQLVGGVETLFQGSQKSFDEFTKSIGTSWSEIAKYQKEAGLAITGTLDSATIGSLQSKYESMSNAHNVVLENAANAYKTAGMSANEYMETVTSFSASLISSLGGDTASAAEYADIAITDMADNANKMGTSIEMIQNAYQGFAKQNYTIKFIYSPAA